MFRTLNKMILVATIAFAINAQAQTEISKQITLSGSSEPNVRQLAEDFLRELVSRNRQVKRDYNRIVADLRQNDIHVDDLTVPQTEIQVIQTGSDFYLGNPDDRLNCGESMPGSFTDQFILTQEGSERRSTELAIAARITVVVSQCQADESTPVPSNAKTIVELRFHNFLSQNSIGTFVRGE